MKAFEKLPAAVPLHRCEAANPTRVFDVVARRIDSVVRLDFSSVHGTPRYRRINLSRPEALDLRDRLTEILMRDNPEKADRC